MVTITPSTNTKTGFQKGQSFNVVLNRGQTYMVQAALESEDITGSYITSSKPIAVFAGNPWTGVPQECSNWDNLLEQMIPINAWGKQFVSAPSAFTSYDLFRILASEDKTNVSVNGVFKSIDKGQYYEYQSNQPSFIKADKPIMVAQYLVGGKCNGHSVGDPSMLLLNSIEQNRDTVILYNSPLQSITENYINLIVQTDDIDNTTIDGAPIGNLSIFRDVVNGSPYSYLTLKVSDGSHLIINKGCGVIASAYGYGPAESYAYGGGANFRPINAAPIIEGACLNDEALFDAGLDSTKVTLSWDFGDGGRSALYKPVHTYKELGTYKVVLIVENLCLMSKDTFTKNIEITSQRNLIGPRDTLVCEKDSIILKAIDENNNANFIWILPNGAEVNQKEYKIPNVSKDNNGIYGVKGIFKGCATKPVYAKLEVKNLPIVTLGSDTTYCISDPPFLRTLGQYQSIKWSDGTMSNSFLIDRPQTLSVQVIDEYGCKNEDTIIVKEFCPTKFYLPNVFSPNEDNVNDVFEAIGVNITTYTIAIYDRWGNLLYNGPKWDGTFNGTIVSNGIYTYLATYDAAVIGGYYEKRTLSGHILVAR
jgi:gliding motility-associated-like protein